MPDASDFPFDASKYAFRTDFDGLTASDDGSKARVDQAAATFKTALTNFESDDKSAREEYDSYKKEDGVTQVEFKGFVDKYYPQWGMSKDDLSGAGTKLTNTALHAFGPEYNNKLQTGLSALTQAGLKEGYQPYFF